MFAWDVGNLLEGQFEVRLVNAQHIKAVPGGRRIRKGECIAELLQHGLLRPSFVPPAPIGDLRDLTRYRASLAEQINRLANRIQKVLEDRSAFVHSAGVPTYLYPAIIFMVRCGRKNHESFISKRHHRIDPNRPSQRNVARDESDDNQRGDG
jgi:Transposase